MKFNLSMLVRNQRIRKRIKKKWNYLDSIKHLLDNKSRDKDKC